MIKVKTYEYASKQINEIGQDLGVTDSDIKEIKNLLNNLSNGLNELDKKMILGFGEVDKRIIELSGQITNTNTKINSLNTRMANQEFIYRAVVIGIIATIATGILSILWIYPFNLS